MNTKVKYLVDGEIYDLKPGYELYLLHDINYFEKPEMVPDDFGMLISKIGDEEYIRVPSSQIRILSYISVEFIVGFMNHELSRRYKEWVGINDDWFISRLLRLQGNFIVKDNEDN